VHFHGVESKLNDLRRHYRSPVQGIALIATTLNSQATSAR
jgi:hypothetical protein